MDENSARALRAMLAHAQAHVPHYQGLSLLNIPAKDDPGEALTRLPLLSRDEVREVGGRLLAGCGERTLWRRVRTTGTTGQAIDIVHDETAQAAETATLSVVLDCWLGGPEWRERRMFHLMLHPEAGSTVMPAGWSDTADIARWNLARLWAQDDVVVRAALISIDNAVVTMMPSVGLLLAERLADKAGIRPAAIILSGETVEPEVRRRIGGVFGCPVRALYTMAEAGIVAVEHDVDEDGYVVNRATVFVEIVEEAGRRVAPGVEGEIVITTLTNFAMPLIRYRTGDRGYWIDRGSGHFRLMQGRPHRYFTTVRGTTIGAVRFAKLLAMLDLDGCEIEQREGVVRVCYKSAHGPLDPVRRRLIETVLRGALGPDIPIEIVRGTAVPPPRSALGYPPPDVRRAEPMGPSVDELCGWLRQHLAAIDGIIVAVLTGSVLDPRNTGRFSDIDLAILIVEEASDEKWALLARELRDRIPTLVTHVDRLAGFAIRAPLVACRLRAEHLLVIGTLDARRLPWPDTADIQCEGMHWAQSTLTILWMQTTGVQPLANNPAYRLWLYFKICLDALRYRYLAAGGRATAAGEIYAAAMRDDELPEAWRLAFSRVRAQALELEAPGRDLKAVVEEAHFLSTKLVQMTQARLLAAHAAKSVTAIGREP